MGSMVRITLIAIIVVVLVVLGTIAITKPNTYKSSEFLTKFGTYEVIQSASVPNTEGFICMQILTQKKGKVIVFHNTNNGDYIKI